MPYGTPSTESALTKPITINTLRKMKLEKRKFVTVALYDAPMAAMAQKTGIELLLVGDSLGMTVLGFDSTVPVTMEHMLYHVEAVSRGNTMSLIMGDMPFMSYSTPELAMANATKIMQAGAHMVKLEGGAWLAPTVNMLADRGIPVCAHLGLTPQSVNKFGGFRVQGRTKSQAESILQDAKLLDQSGADLLVLECVPVELAKKITESVSMPVIGIGAGKDTDAQVLVINDILGLTERPPKFSKNFLVETASIPGALKKYADDTRNEIFPAEEHIFC
ncbi:3-methyl-2-oxobutanoate hydroxymethyltransferase [Marinibactrum halimedae]|uniref:3-methyl-2-oxobutanoate hydroxymethyltransferase n=1 Tax=Marinibactrum halimedae TaxID=1444977 RepID=A0AA37TAK3_9GAMM|nr:3-methyl-2-oxobutanoate hydroxymethyltransferase [Marinibactrum halimedae]MCD9458994.1 3-methyl-2-oxobutanoate hydroxymethyltransferase [Marinibactrum halimedae]GLS26876.1 3-methyl-2-oxobutanoate hydroxymethyltransferase [Marinibactrum halimedae]